MGLLTKDSIDKWYALLPEDVASSMEKPDDAGQAHSDAISEEARQIKSGAGVLGFVDKNAEAFIGMGRARRLRFLAWVADADYPDKMIALRDITEVGESEGSDGGRGKVAPYFKEDVRALVEALGPRVTHGVVDAQTLAAVKGAAFEVTGELEMRSGGSI